MSSIFAAAGRSGSAVTLFVLLFAGCAGEPQSDTYAVTGQISYQGKPISRGNIQFAPDASQGNTGPGTSAEIRDGKYQTQPGKGVVGGPYVLTVNGYDGVPIPSGEGGMDEQGKPLFPPRDVKADFPKEDTTHDIDLKK